MSKNTQLLEKVKKLKEWKKGKAFIAKELDITEGEVDKLVLELKSLESENYEETEERSIKIDAEKGILESQVVSSFEPKSDKELAELHKVDTTKYKIASYWTKQRGDKFTSSLLCNLIKPSDIDPKQFAEFVKGYKSTFKPSKIVKKDRGGVDVEISLADFHIDKLDIDGETIEDRKEQYIRILTSLMAKVTGAYSIDTIVFTVGNDFFQTDSYNNTTTKGTPVDYSTTWNNAYEEGFDLMVWAISYLRELCNDMEIIFVPGNHDRTKGYYLAHALSVYFAPDKNIYFNRTDSPFKYTVLGSTFLGYHHGDGKLDELPLIFATGDGAASFGSSKYREVHTGDKHHYMAKEVKGVRILQLPSLSGTDRWHRDSQFIHNVRAGLALVYHPQTGKCGEFEERIQI